tara:strand:- start:1475 stop:1705 length:231 start_codon:yes stop_codon:yes gene_type:complete
MPDVILAHHGWCELMFLKDVWPEAKVAIYCEFYYGSGLQLLPLILNSLSIICKKNRYGYACGTSKMRCIFILPPLG